MTEYDRKQAEDIFKTNALVGIPEELTALGLARKYQKEEDWQRALAVLKQGSGYRRNGRSIADLLAEVCAPKPAELVLYNGIPQVHDYDEKHLLVEGVSSVDADGKVVGSYDRLLVMKDVFRDKDGNIQFFTPYQAIKRCEQEGYFLPPTNLTVPLAAALFQHRSIPEANKVLLQYKDKGNGNGWHAQNSVIDCKNQKMIHYPKNTDFSVHGGTDTINQSARIALPFSRVEKKWLAKNKQLESTTLEKGLQNPLTAKFAKQVTGLVDPSIVVEIGNYFQKPAYLWISSSTETWAAWFGCGSDNLSLDGGNNLDSDSAARGVRLVSP